MDATLTPRRILALMNEPLSAGERSLDLHDRLLRDASVTNLVAALRAAEDPDDRQMLIDLLGFRHSKLAIPALLDELSAAELQVRAAAADALGKSFGYARVPPPRRRQHEAMAALSHRWEVEESDAVRSTLAQTLALVGDPAARSLLAPARGHQDRRVRNQVEWGLGYLDRLDRR